THTYADEGSFSVSVKATNKKGETATGTFSIAVADPAVIPSAVNFNAIEGLAFTGQSVATFTDPGGAETVPHYSATINWGDGTATSTGTISASGGVFTVKGNHTYADEGGYSVTVTISHDAAPNAAVTSSATVADPAVIPSSVNFSATEG